MAAGKSAGKPPRMTDNAFKPPTEAAMAMTGNETPASETGAVPPRGISSGKPRPCFRRSIPRGERTALAGFSGRRSGFDFVFMVMLANFAGAGVRRPPPSGVGLNHAVDAGGWGLSSRANRRTDLADFTTSCCVLAISCLRPLVLFRAFCFNESQPDIDAQQRLGDFILEFMADFFAFILLRLPAPDGSTAASLPEVQGILEQLGVVDAADLEGGFHALAPDEAAL